MYTSNLSQIRSTADSSVAYVISMMTTLHNLFHMNKETNLVSRSLSEANNSFRSAKLTFLKNKALPMFMAATM